MCSINGFIKFNKEKKIDTRIISGLLYGGIERGRDSAGIYTVINQDIIPNSIEHLYKSVEPGKNKEFVSDFIINSFDEEDTVLLLNNMRAEPTSNSEWIKYKTINDTQPFLDKRSVVIHNGTISNDVLWTNVFNDLGFISPNNLIVYKEGHVKIDSCVFLNNENVDELRTNLKDYYLGSYAIAQYFKESKELVLATNYMPLYLCFDYTNEVIYFASSKESFLTKHMNNYEIFDFPSYSMVVIDTRLSFNSNVKLSKNSRSIYSSNDVNEKHLVVCSGGLDSSTLLNHVVKKVGADNVKILHFQYSCKAEVDEYISIRYIADRLNVDYEIIVLDNIFKNILSSRLTDKENISVGDTGIEYAHEWVPARNLIMMSVAIGYAEKNGFTNLYLGANLDEASAYPDNSVDFLDKLNTLIPYSVQNGKRLQIRRPMVNLMKHEIVKLAIEENAPLDLMWSCYHDGDKHCGKCGPCLLRKLAFEKNGIKDNYIEYEDCS